MAPGAREFISLSVMKMPLAFPWYGRRPEAAVASRGMTLRSERVSHLARAIRIAQATRSTPQASAARSSSLSWVANAAPRLTASSR